MTSLGLSPLTELPSTRPNQFDPPVEFRRIREVSPLRRMVFPDGHIGWLATGYSEVRAVLGDQRFTSRYELLHLPYPMAGVSKLMAAPPGDLSGVDAPQHTRYRRVVAGKFTVRRMRQLTDRIDQITTVMLDEMERHGPPVDLVTAYAQPVPGQVICEMLGVPLDDRGRFQSHALTMSSLDASEQQLTDAWAEITRYIGGLVRAKRSAPTDDLLSDMTDSDLTDDELAGLGSFLLSAALMTTANMIALGFLALSAHPEQLEAWRVDPALTDQAIEELLRFLTITPTGVRAALEDAEIDGQVIKAGESVALSIQSANRDPRRFPDPDALDIRRNARGQLGFGFGIHQCLGQHLARAQMRTAMPALLARFPTLRLAIPVEQVPMRGDCDIYGVYRLPVEW
jgi:cytochrome P450